MTARHPSASTTAPAQLSLSDGSLYNNRELSWLEFNQRVLDQALDPSHPLLKRVRFLAIVGSNLDEFFMVRVATLLRRYRAGQDELSCDGLNLTQQLQSIRRRATVLLKDQGACWDQVLRPSLAKEGVRFIDPDEYD